MKTLRQIIEKCNINNVIDILLKKHEVTSENKDQYENVYKSVINNLLDLKGDTDKSWPIHVQTRKDDFDNTEYISVGLINPSYVEPPENFKAWYGEDDDIVPQGHYNANLEKYTKYWGFGGSEWRLYIDAKVINESDCNNDCLVAEIIWEITFYGFDEKTNKKFFDSLTERLDKVLKEEKKKKSTKKSNKKQKNKKCKKR
jgi:hypothetical protein